MATFPLARNMPFRNVAHLVRQLGSRFGEKDLLNARKLCVGRAAYRGFATKHCVARMARQIRAVESVKEASAFSESQALTFITPNL